MSTSPDEILALYDAYAARLFALALRITGDRDAASEVIASVFASRGVPAELGPLIRVTRALALHRSAHPSAKPPESRPAARELVEEAFFSGRSATDLAATYGLPEKEVRSMLRQGIAALQPAAEG